MKTKITALVLIAVSALTLAPKPAQAGDKEFAIIGGLIGGLIIGSAINDSRPHDYETQRTVIVDRRANDRCDGPDGRWEDVTVQVWVSGIWIAERGRHGRSYNRYIPGHYERRTSRAWVRYDRHDRRDREVGSGYGRRR